MAGPAFAQYREIEVTTGAKVLGSVTWEGEIPPSPDFEAERDTRYCAPMRTKSNDLVDVDSKSRGVRNAVVYLDPIYAGKPLDRLGKAKSLTLSFQRCAVVPRLALVSSRDRLRFTSIDDVVHQVSVTGPSAWTGEASLASLGSEEQIRLPKQGFYMVRCSRHPWESAVAVRADHPYFAVTDEKGRFELSDIPQGSYTVKAWHAGMRAKAVFRNGLVADYRFSAPLTASVRVRLDAGGEESVRIRLQESPP
jgi:hypothetical protein